jgi:uncharacterized protein YndB with AHSA1/START domain
LTPPIRYEFSAQQAMAASPEEVMRWLEDPALMARWIIGVDRAESVDRRVRLTVATTVARQHIATTYTGETIERTAGRFVRRYNDTHDDVTIDRTITYELEPTPAGCTLTCSVTTDVEGIPARIVRASRRDHLKSIRRSLRRLAVLVKGGEPSRWALYIDRRQTGQTL